MNKRTFLLFEDEPRAARLLERMLAKLRPDWNCLASASDVQEGLEAIRNFPEVDLVISDIELSDGLSFNALSELRSETPVIFVTAYNHYAIKAFDHYSMAYILKPLQEDELSRALAKLEAVWDRSEKRDQRAWEQVISSIKNDQQAYKSRFVVKVGEKLKFFPTESILHFYSESGGTYLFTDAHRSYAIDRSLDQVELELDPDVFFRINRSCIVSTAAISEITQHSNSRLRIVLAGRESDLTVVSRDRTSTFKQWLDA